MIAAKQGYYYDRKKKNDVSKQCDARFASYKKQYIVSWYASAMKDK